MSKDTSYKNSVFINCPFDEDYYETLDKILYTIYACGYYPRFALNSQENGDERIKTIIDLISLCKYSIHDISRVKLDQKKRLPRFNMPFELGIDFGCRVFGEGEHKDKAFLVFESKKYRAKKYLSDLAGMDMRCITMEPDCVFKTVRDWLNIQYTHSKEKSSNEILVGEMIIKKGYEHFQQEFPSECNARGINPKGVSYRDKTAIMSEWLVEYPKISPIFPKRKSKSYKKSKHKR